MSTSTNFPERSVEQSPAQKSLALSIARVAHEMNAVYCLANGEPAIERWEDAPNWMRSSAIEGVSKHLANPDMTPEDSHKSWMAHKVAEGWTYGPTKDSVQKTHPCMVPYVQLPLTQQIKDHLFRGIVHTIAREMARV